MGAGWMSGLLGRPRTRGEAVDERLRSFVAPVVDVTSDGEGDLESVRTPYARVRGSLQGAANLNQRLNAEPGEPEWRPPERNAQGESFMVTMLAQRPGRKRRG